jgi:hypothetical protein
MESMSRLVLFTLSLVLLVTGVPRAEGQSENPGLALGISISQSFGDTEYELRGKSEDPGGSGELVDIRSELAFPLDATLVGLLARWSPGPGPYARWMLTARIDINVTDPSDKATDDDWIGKRHISYAESNTNLDMVSVNTDVCYRLRSGSRSALSLLFHFDYQRVEEYLVGFEGWRASLFSDERFPVSGTAPVIDYKVEHLSPQLGAVGYYRFGDSSRLALQASSGPVYAWDRDDHLLRGRIAEGKVWGFGLNSKVALDLLPGFAPLGWLSVNLTGELRFFHAKGNVDQRWYRDEDLPAGTEILDIPYKLESLQAQVSFSVGGSF